MVEELKLLKQNTNPETHPHTKDFFEYLDPSEFIPNEVFEDVISQKMDTPVRTERRDAVEWLSNIVQDAENQNRLQAKEELVKVLNGKYSYRSKVRRINSFTTRRWGRETEWNYEIVEQALDSVFDCYIAEPELFTEEELDSLFKNRFFLEKVNNHRGEISCQFSFEQDMRAMLFSSHEEDVLSAANSLIQVVRISDNDFQTQRTSIRLLSNLLSESIPMRDNILRSKELIAIKKDTRKMFEGLLVEIGEGKGSINILEESSIMHNMYTYNDIDEMMETEEGRKTLEKAMNAFYYSELSDTVIENMEELLIKVGDENFVRLFRAMGEDDHERFRDDVYTKLVGKILRNGQQAPGYEELRLYDAINLYYREQYEWEVPSRSKREFKIWFNKTITEPGVVRRFVPLLDENDGDFDQVREEYEEVREILVGIALNEPERFFKTFNILKPIRDNFLERLVLDLEDIERGYDDLDDMDKMFAKMDFSNLNKLFLMINEEYRDNTGDWRHVDGYLRTEYLTRDFEESQLAEAYDIEPLISYRFEDMVHFLRREISRTDMRALKAKGSKEVSHRAKDYGWAEIEPESLDTDSIKKIELQFIPLIVSKDANSEELLMSKLKGLVEYIRVSGEDLGDLSKKVKATFTIIKRMNGASMHECLEEDSLFQLFTLNQLDDDKLSTDPIEFMSDTATYFLNNSPNKALKLIRSNPTQSMIAQALDFAKSRKDEVYYYATLEPANLVLQSQQNDLLERLKSTMKELSEPEMRAMVGLMGRSQNQEIKSMLMERIFRNETNVPLIPIRTSDDEKWKILEEHFRHYSRDNDRENTRLFRYLAYARS